MDILFCYYAKYKIQNARYKLYFNKIIIKIIKIKKYH